jgi:hypothetical protein
MHPLCIQDLPVAYQQLTINNECHIKFNRKEIKGVLNKYKSTSLRNKVIIIIIISLLMFPLLGHMPSLWITHKENGL